MARTPMTLNEWCIKDEELKLAFFKYEIRRASSLLTIKEIQVNYFICKTLCDSSGPVASKIAMALHYEGKYFKVAVPPETFEELKKKFRSFKLQFRNKQENRIKKQLTLDNNTQLKLEDLIRSLHLNSVNSCLSILIDFYNKNKEIYLKRDSKIKSLEDEIKVLNNFIKEQNTIINQQKEIISSKNSEYLSKNKMEKKIEFLKEELIEKQSKNYIFEEYKKMLTDDEIKEIENHLTEKDYQNLKNEIKETIDRELKMIDWKGELTL
ncbi:hypothetical protein [Acinetobacter baumannii]|uniref:hypothetical protein n=1 Tax=Acinetobacter baumannii TaxID=470 RepID=UPI00244C081C|nr:hypothetical protein [Acinetobacter baumannii]MDH2488092.1 hypothetical protein [Acinetobacter baumannii]